jgi:hypothetical protein
MYIGLISTSDEWSDLVEEKNGSSDNFLLFSWKIERNELETPVAIRDNESMVVS